MHSLRMHVVQGWTAGHEIRGAGGLERGPRGTELPPRVGAGRHPAAHRGGPRRAPRAHPLAGVAPRHQRLQCPLRPPPLEAAVCGAAPALAAGGPRGSR